MILALRLRMGILLCASACPLTAQAQSGYNQTLDRRFTLRDPAPLRLEAESDRMIRGGKRFSFIFPRPCFSGVDSSRVCGERHGLTYGDSTAAEWISFSPEGGYEYRRDGENAHALELGSLITGSKGQISYNLDARMYTEFHEDFLHASYDREFVERQDEATSGSVSYSSYSRYRADFDYDLPWGRFSLGRDVPHWGPGLYGNLVFNRDAVPFNQVTFTSSIGPFRVQTLYGQLSTSGDRFYKAETSNSSVYGHRYEWSIGPDWLAGVSEQLIVFDSEEPFAFIPIVPLFIFKGDAYEHLNNGSLAADLNWRFARWGRMYTEFLIDDMQSPTSLFGDQWGNKWAAMAGCHAVGDIRSLAVGGILEAARVEPWVYTHYDSMTSQAANGGYPLGNQLGPNSLSLTAAAYLRSPRGLTLSSTLKLEWKGTDLGSSVHDVWKDGVVEKTFLGGQEGPEVAERFECSAPFGRTTISAAADLKREPQGRLSLFFRL